MGIVPQHEFRLTPQCQSFERGLVKRWHLLFVKRSTLVCSLLSQDLTLGSGLVLLWHSLILAASAGASSARVLLGKT
eukprot:3197272-Amphidinium_carterae.1